MNETRQGTGGRNPRGGACSPDTCCVRGINWRDWRGVAVLFRRIFPEIRNAQVAYYIRRYEDTIGVAEAGAGLIGFYQFLPWINERTAWLNYLGVLPSQCHRGAGTRLLRDYEVRAAKMGFVRAELDVLQQNIKAINFYEKNGYTRQQSVDNKFRYRKALAAGVAAPGCTPTQKRTRVKRLGRRALYLMLVTLPLLISDL